MARPSITPQQTRRQVDKQPLFRRQHDPPYRLPEALQYLRPPSAEACRSRRGTLGSARNAEWHRGCTCSAEYRVVFEEAAVVERGLIVWWGMYR